MEGETRPLPVSSFSIEKPYKIMRRSIYTFLQHYHYFATVAALLAMPFSASALLSQAFIPSSPLFSTIWARLYAIFNATGFNRSYQMYVLSMKLSQSILIVSCTLPCTVSCLLIAMACTIKVLIPRRPAFPSPSFVSLYTSLVLTYICCCLVIVTATACAFSLIFLGFSFCEGLGVSSANWLVFVSSAGAVTHSIILASMRVICNLALVISGMERSHSSFSAKLEACVQLKDKSSAAMLLAMPTNLLLASVEGLFQYRIVRSHDLTGKLSASMAWESLFIAYLYSILVILDIVVSCTFFESCNRNLFMNGADTNSYRIDINGKEDKALYVKLKGITKFSMMEP